MITTLQMDLLPEGIDDLSLISRELFKIYDIIKAEFPDVYVNCKKGKRLHNHSGYRKPDSRVGAANSAHKLGKALDLHRESKRENLDLYEWIIQNGAAHGICRMEDKKITIDNSPGYGWVHIDIAEGNQSRPNQWHNGIYVFIP
ncbi:MAG: hypothetical protein LBC75_11975 [Fibromonadaceae bacterium]|nr:hypothetical protein [Fibromonadaceae bacterium]